MGQGPEFWWGEEGTNLRAMLAGTFEKKIIGREFPP